MGSSTSLNNSKENNYDRTSFVIRQRSRSFSNLSGINLSSKDSRSSTSTLTNSTNNSSNNINIDNKSKEKLSNFPKYLINKIRDRESKSLSPSQNRKSIKNKPFIQLTQKSKQAFSSEMALRPKTNPIHEDYFISREVLGLGISGKVLSCTNKQTKVKYALKVKLKIKNYI